MSLEKNIIEDIAPEIPDSPEKSEAIKELEDLGIELIPENISAVIEQMQFSQHPEGFEDILSKLDSPEELKIAMEENGIISIIHSEGRKLWDHTKSALQEIETLDMSSEMKKFLKLILLYHDLGKIVSVVKENNIQETEKRIKKGELHQVAIGHEDQRLEDIEAGLRSNGFTSERLNISMMLIKYHMKSNLMRQKAKKTVKLFELFGENDEERKAFVILLVLILQIDGNATDHISLVNRELEFTKNQKKLSIDFESIWKKYEEGQALIKEEESKRRKKEEEKKLISKLEHSIFGKIMIDYIKEDRGITHGPSVGKAVRKIKEIIQNNSEKSPDEIRDMIDVTEL